MKTKNLIIKSCLTLIAAIGISCVATRGDKWQNLFNGTNLEGWKQRGGIATFEVIDGTIVGTTVKGTPNSFLCTEKEFSDFIFEAEVLVDKNLNSGVQFRSLSLPSIENGRVHGYQLEVDEAVGGFSGRIWDEGRRKVWLDRLVDTVGVRNAFKVGEWNKLQIEAIGPKIKTFVNGFKVAEVTDSLTSKGFIALQVHRVSDNGRKVRWKNIRIKEK